MKKKFKLLSLIAIGSSMVIGTVALSISGSFKSALFPVKAETYNRTILFSKDTADSYASSAGSESGRYNNTITKATSGGNDIVCTVADSTTSINDSSNIGNLREFTRVSFSSAYSLSGKPFQGVTSITVTSNSTAERTLRIYFNNSATYESLTVPFRGTATLDTSDKTIKSFEIAFPSGGQYTNFALVSVSIGYTCSTDYVDETKLESITLSDQTTSYHVGDSFSFDGVVTAHYDDLTSAIVTPTSVTSPDMSTTGSKEVTVSYTEGGITKTATYSIEVTEAATGLSGVYRLLNSQSQELANFTFNNDGSTGVYTVAGYSSYDPTEFSYTISGNSIVFHYLSGENSFGNYCLFSGGSSPVDNSTATFTDSSISLKTYNSWGTGYNRVFNKA